jgi:hypothetical protein
MDTLRTLASILSTKAALVESHLLYFPYMMVYSMSNVMAIPYFAFLSLLTFVLLFFMTFMMLPLLVI